MLTFVKELLGRFEVLIEIEKATSELHLDLVLKCYMYLFLLLLSTLYLIDHFLLCNLAILIHVADGLP